MPKRKSSILDDIFEIFLLAPWWFGLPFAALVYFLFHNGVPMLLEYHAASNTDPIAGTMRRTLAQIYGPVSVRLAPLITLIVLGVWVVSLFKRPTRQRRR
jgi:hypothetical protein